MWEFYKITWNFKRSKWPSVSNHESAFTHLYLRVVNIKNRGDFKQEKPKSAELFQKEQLLILNVIYFRGNLLMGDRKCYKGKDLRVTERSLLDNTQPWAYFFFQSQTTVEYKPLPTSAIAGKKKKSISQRILSLCYFLHCLNLCDSQLRWKQLVQ